jgi:hypothetical protein
MDLEQQQPWPAGGEQRDVLCYGVDRQAQVPELGEAEVIHAVFALIHIQAAHVGCKSLVLAVAVWHRTKC